MRVWRLSLAAGVLLVPAAASAAGYYIPDAGTTARARGGAFCADADDPLAMIYNPAGEADQHTRNQLLIDVTDVDFRETFAREKSTIATDAPPGDPTTVTNAASPPQIVPEIIYLHSVNDQLTVGAGIIAPTGPRFTFPTDGAQRYTNTSLYLIEAGVGITGAYRFNKYVAVGLDLNAMIYQVTQDFTLSENATTTTSEAPVNDVPAVLKVQEVGIPSGVLGVMVNPVDQWSVGATYRPEISVDAPGTLDSPSQGINQKVHFHYKIPAIGRLGVRYNAGNWDAELDGVVETWSVHNTEVLTADSGAFKPSGLASNTVTRDFQNAYSLRAGSGFRLTESLKGMAGIFFETSAVPDHTMDVGTYDAPKVGLSIGIKYALSQNLDIAGNFTHIQMTSVTVTDSNQTQQTPFSPTTAGKLSTIGDGTYSGTYEIAGIQLLAKF